MPLHDKPVSNYPHKIAQPHCVVAWLKADAYESIKDDKQAKRYYAKLGILLELKEARLKHEREGQL